MNLLKEILDALLKPDFSFTTELGSGYSQEEDEAQKRLLVLRYARAQLGKPYKLGAEVNPGDEPTLLDCSELVQCAYRDGAGLDCVDGCIYQQAQFHRVKSPQPGDLIFLGPSVKGTRHVMIVSGPGLVIHAKGGVGVIEESDHAYTTSPRFQGYFRYPDFARKPEDRA